MEMKIILTEKKGEDGRQLQYVKTVEGNSFLFFNKPALSVIYVIESGKRIVQVEALGDNNQASSSIRELLSSIFLPQGYPYSVSEDYLPYQIWDTIQVYKIYLSL